VSLLLEAGEEISLHKTRVGALFQIMTDSRRVTVDDESQIVISGDFVERPRGQSRALPADQEEPLSVHVMQVPSMQTSSVCNRAAVLPPA